MIVGLVVGSRLEKMVMLGGGVVWIVGGRCWIVV